MMLTGKIEMPDFIEKKLNMILDFSLAQQEKIFQRKLEQFKKDCER